MRVLTVFDDTMPVTEVIRDVIGQRGFADVVIKKQRLGNYYAKIMKQSYPETEWKEIRSHYEFLEYAQKFTAETLPADTKILHCYSNHFIVDADKALLALEKLKYVDKPYRVMAEGSLAAIMFPSPASYQKFLSGLRSNVTTQEAAWLIEDSFLIEGLANIGVIGNFIQCITGNFDSRYFNSLKGNEYTITKTSRNKKKIKSEYMFYQLLPEDMQPFMVIPFRYEENEETASYTMERLHMTDLAVKWVHGSIDEEEFEEILDKYFYFFNIRHRKEISKEEYQAIEESLYVKKVADRVEELKKCECFDKIAKLMEAGCELPTMDAVFAKYLELKEKIQKTRSYPAVSVIGHGDPFFANTLYNKATKTLKFVDPKGALTEEELWTNPYYDIAKLSHSICGRYDFFNNALFDIRINDRFQSELNIEFDNAAYVNAFRRKVEAAGFDYPTVRLYEASLFISMLPLHIDNPHKVFGFILNAIQILKEVEAYV